MLEISVGLVFIILLILCAEFVNGWTDAPNAIATVISTRVLKPLHAVIMASLLNLAGVLLAGTAVATTIGTGIVNPGMINLTTIGAAMMGIIIFSMAAWYFGLPTSESHALVAGLTGAALAQAGPQTLLWVGWKKVLMGLGFSTFLGFGCGFLLMVLIHKLFQRVALSKIRVTFGRLQIFSAAFMSFSHGTNDGQKFIGVFTLALVLSGALPEFKVPIWVIFVCAAVMACGTIIGGWRIIRTMGFKLTKLEPVQGFAAETAAAATIEFASRIGIPVSTTHTINTAIMGVGATRRFSAVRWGVTMRIVSAWILTFPCCAAIAFMTAKIALWFG